VIGRAGQGMGNGESKVVWDQILNSSFSFPGHSARSASTGSIDAALLAGT
jgi:hypothetical protein